MMHWLHQAAAREKQASHKIKWGLYLGIRHCMVLPCPAFDLVRFQDSAPTEK